MRPVSLRLVLPGLVSVALIGAHAATAHSYDVGVRRAAAAGFADSQLLTRQDLTLELRGLASGSPATGTASVTVLPAEIAPEAVPAVAPAVVDGQISALAAGGIPAASLAAYQRAAASIAVSDPTCGLQWTLLAAIGRIESGHGRSGGAVVLADGRSVPPIIGNQLNGDGPFAEILDTEDGTMDGDAVYDRAVGPMQFLPGTWRSSGRDGDGDGVNNVHDIDDAALAAGVYLCAGATTLTDEGGLRGAIFRYNRSDEYVNTVIALMNAYATGQPATLPNATSAPPVEPLAVVPSAPASPPGPGPSTEPPPPPPPPPSPTPTPSPTPDPTPTPTPSPTPTPTPDPCASPTPSPMESPSPSPTESPSPCPTPTPTDSGSPTPSP